MTRVARRANELPTRPSQKAVNDTAMDEDDYAEQAISDDGLGFDDLANQDSEESEGSSSPESSDGDPDELMSDVSGQWGGLTETTHEPSSKAGARTSTSRKETAHLSPTTQDIRRVKDAEDLYSSNAFKLQIDTLLSSIRPRQKYVPALEKCLLDLYSVITAIPHHPPSHPLRAAESLKKTGVATPYPQPLPTEDVKFTVAYENPTDVKVVGSWGNKVATMSKDGEGFGVDVALEMPSNLFNEKDYLNSRFFHKRAYYLAVIGKAIASARDRLCLEVNYESPQMDESRTVLLLRPISTSTSPSDLSKLKVTIRLILSLSSQTTPIPISRLSPSHANLRVVVTQPAGSGTIINSTLPATPRYNNNLVQAFTPTPHLLSVYQFKLEIPAFGNALALIRVWANQRGYAPRGKRIIRGFETIGGSWWSFLLAYLVYGPEPSALKGSGRKRNTIGRGLSSYQLFRGVLDFLSNHKFIGEAVVMEGSAPPKFPMDEFVAQDTSSFVDPALTYNFFSGVPIESLLLLKYDARNTLSLLDGDLESFRNTFMKEERELPGRFDAVLRIDLSNARLRVESQWEALEHGSRMNAVVHFVSSVVKRSMGNRVNNFAISHPSSSPRPLSEAVPSDQTIFDLGLLFNPTEASRSVDHGPPASDEEGCAAFREFWGPKSELRRFKDGSIEESVVWNISKPEERQHLPITILQYILGYHLALRTEDMLAFHSDFDQLLAPIARCPIACRTGFRLALTAFDDLVKIIKSVGEDVVPLSLANVAGASIHLRHTSVFPPHNVDLPQITSSPLSAPGTYISPIDIVITYERSTRWPEDLAAIQKIKLAFFEALARDLSETHQDTIRSSCVVLDDDAGVIEDSAYLEILTHEGFAFRARMYCELERTLLERLLGPKPSGWKVPQLYTVAKSDAKRALALHLRRFVQGPAHHDAIATLHNRNTSFGPAARLVARWLGAHLLLPYVPMEVIELLSASVFATGHAPASATRGFAQVIKMLSEWDYEDMPLLVPLYTFTASDVGAICSFPKDKRTEAETKFNARLGEICWSVVTERDTSGTAFGIVGGPKGILPARIKQVAIATWKTFCDGMNGGNLKVMELFTHPLGDYDFIIHLNPAILSRYYENAHFDPAALPSNSKSKTKPLLNGDAKSDELLIGFDPATLLFEDLRRVYAHTAMFFMDSLGGNIIAGIWNPQYSEGRPWKVFAGYSTMLSGAEANDSTKPMVVLNQKAILAEIERLGTGIIRQIVVSG